ncbi:unnamed protein product, partial [Ectocarpus sp. 12 AP-2014]
EILHPLDREHSKRVVCHSATEEDIASKIQAIAFGKASRHTSDTPTLLWTKSSSIGITWARGVISCVVYDTDHHVGTVAFFATEIGPTGVTSSVAYGARKTIPT